MYVWVISIAYKNKKDFNADLDNYLSQRRGESKSFFSKVDSFFPKSASEKVPSVSSTSSTVYDDGSKKQKRFLFIFKRRSRTADKMEEEMEIHEKELTPEEKAELQSLEEEVREVDTEETLLEVEKQSAIARFFGMLFGKRGMNDDFEEINEEQVESAVQEDTLKDETRVVLKALHKWISRLPPDQIEAFRRSQDFEMYKSLLEKYGLVK